MSKLIKFINISNCIQITSTYYGNIYFNLLPNASANATTGRLSIFLNRHEIGEY